MGLSQKITLGPANLGRVCICLLVNIYLWNGHTICFQSCLPLGTVRKRYCMGTEAFKKNDCPVLSLKGVAEMLSDRCGGQGPNEQLPHFS